MPRRPSPELLDLLAPCSPGVMHLALTLRDLVLAEAPDAEEALYAVYAQVIVFRLPGCRTGAFCNVAAYSRHVNLMFFHGAGLPDPHRLLEGTGKQMRHIKFTSPDDIRPAFVRPYLRSAIEFAHSLPPAASRKKPAPKKKRH